MKENVLPVGKYEIVDVILFPADVGNIISPLDIVLVLKQTTTYQNLDEYFAARGESILRVMSELYDNIHRPVVIKSGNGHTFPFAINPNLEQIFKNSFTVSSVRSHMNQIVKESMEPEIPTSTDPMGYATNWLAAWLDHWCDLSDDTNNGVSQYLYDDLLSLVEKVSEEINCSGYAAVIVVGIWLKNILDKDIEFPNEVLKV